ncbi:hypothetical protein RDI58_024301 [Solanum bulbocastanum]|uniref:Transmembrane protein n=1 Tax=Solanum bulbocastanum TaxID=147425 RepID=A0AAN8Y5H1_SOLBU
MKRELALLLPAGCSCRKREKRGGEGGFSSWKHRSLLLHWLTTIVLTEMEEIVATAFFVVATIVATISAIGPCRLMRRKRNRSEGKWKKGGSNWREEERERKRWHRRWQDARRLEAAEATGAVLLLGRGRERMKDF